MWSSKDFKPLKKSALCTSAFHDGQHGGKCPVCQGSSRGMVHWTESPAEMLVRYKKRIIELQS